MTSIAVLGTGYVGLVSGACLADFGNTVLCVDTNTDRINRLARGEMPIYEPGLGDIVQRNVQAGRLGFSADIPQAVRQNDVIFIAVGTPPAEDGSTDLSSLETAAHMIGKEINGYKTIVDKSTTPIGTARKVAAWIRREASARGLAYDFDVISNPEFLREGSAIYDFMHPDRVVIGAETGRCMSTMRDVYRSLYLNDTPFIETDLETAEMIKYASNAFLAVKISYINEIANLCEEVGADVRTVALAMGRDCRIGSKFLHPGPGYGGSCLPKDTKALANMARQRGCELRLVEAAIRTNEDRVDRMVDKIVGALGSLEGRVIAVLGLAFKPNTDDMREAPSIPILRRIIGLGAGIRAYDPQAMKEARWRLSDIDSRITYCADEYDAMKGADALAILTEWDQFRNLDLQRAKKLLNAPILMDLRNIYGRLTMEDLGFHYYGVGQ